MLEQVLELWDQLPDAAARTGTDHVGVLMLAADAARWAGQARMTRKTSTAAHWRSGGTGPKTCAAGPSAAAITSSKKLQMSW
jgi:hypothetical protein